MSGGTRGTPSDVSPAFPPNSWSARLILAIRLPRTAPRLTLLALHAGLSTDEQLRVFEPAENGRRKVIVATNIAEVRIAC
jgi:HrpA-like RNA helicase